jgi:hypothetical protein
MTNDRYILNKQGKPVPEPDLHKWADWMETGHARVVSRQHVGESIVSTIFLGLDHNYAEEGPPILWETLVFKGRMHGTMQRCSGSREQAESMHAEMVNLVKAKNEKAKD